VIFSLVAVTLLGATALGTDVAILYMNWMRLQKATDASALAGANYLPNDPGTAKSTAKTYALANGVTSAEWITPTITPNNLQITVGAQRAVPYYFARVLGMTTGNVSVSSTATTQGAPSCIGCPTLVGGQGSGSGGSASGGSSGGGTTVVGSGSGSTAAVCGTSTTIFDVIPIVVDNQTASAWTSGGAYTLDRTNKNGNGPWVDAPGNWGPVQLCGNQSGGQALRQSISAGYYGPIGIGQTLQTQPGADIGNTNQGFADRLGLGDDNYPAFSPTDPRAVIVPMANFSGCTGNCSVTVTGFLAFYIDSYNGGAISGHFIKMVAANSAGDPTVTTDAGVMADPILIK
jgi:Flp pilus assembly protein TadG